ncbi:MAG: hypothetical protein JXB19_03315 [Bacteroidales bacterium]|nr:hypothetical protein [Bacteroidales bacterium]
MKSFLVVLLLLLLTAALHAQEDEFERLLNEEVENINPVYKPVVGFGVGVMNYFGDVKNNYYSPTIGTLGYKINLSTYIDNKHVLKADFYFMGGKINGNERSYTNPPDNFNFQTSIYNFGFDINYDFDHLYRKKDRRIHPFISIGFSTMLFNSKTDSIGSYFDPALESDISSRYYYWTDGTIRNMPQTAANVNISRIMKRDFTYETPLREHDWGLGQYPEYAFVIPFDFGIDMMLSDRLMIRLGNSFCYTFSDVVDHVSSKNTSGKIGKKGNDMFNFTYVSFHLDLFSSAKTLRIERLFREMEFDPMLFGDEDNDGWMDGWDDCPGTPLGVVTDSSGCPVDSDNDGIYDYLDQEPFSTPGAYVDDEGVEMTEDDVIALLDKSLAVGRNEIDRYIRRPEFYTRQNNGNIQIPEKFKSIDTDQDNYISFDEMLREIDRYFDFESTLTANDIYELNSFFFSQ